MILTNDGHDYLIEPIIGHTPTESEANPHLIYRADHVRKARSLGSEDRHLPCGTNGELIRCQSAFVQVHATFQSSFHCCVLGCIW